MTLENPIKIIQDGIIGTIKSASDSGILGYGIPNVGSYGGEMDDDIPHFIKNGSPSIWVVYGSENDPGAEDGLKDMAATFAVLIYVRNDKSESASRDGSCGQTGIYQIIYDIKRLLTEQTFGLPIEELACIAVDPILNGKVAGYYSSIYAIKFRTRYQTGAFDNDANLQEFLRIKSTWTIGTDKSDLNINLRSKKDG